MTRSSTRTRSRPSGTVLVLTEQFDPTADLVVTALRAREIPVFRCDTAQFPSELRLAAELGPDAPDWGGELRNEHRRLRLDNIRCAYYRRPTVFHTSSTMAETTRDWIVLQARLGFGGVLAATDRWFNHPSRIGFAEYKPVQLQAAAAAGLDLPRTLITNDPAAATAFAERVGEVVYKPLAPMSDGAGAIYTNRVTARELADPSIAGTAHLFQEWITKDYEVRLTVVDDVFFAVAITAGSDAAAIDWRTDYDSLSYRVIETPERVRDRVGKLLGNLGLRFAAMDFAVTPTGEWLFLDLNPNGQWAWIQQRTGLDIAGTIADALIDTGD